MYPGTRILVCMEAFARPLPPNSSVFRHAKRMPTSVPEITGILAICK